jgi:site-specific recombinase XerD
VSERYNGSKTFDISIEPKAHPPAGRAGQPLADFLQSLKRQKVSASTLRGYSTDLKSFFDYLNLTAPARRSDNEGGESLDITALQKVQPQDIESYLKSLAEKRLKFSTIKRNVAAIRRFFSFLVDQGIITSDPAKFLTVRPVANSALTFEQVLSLFEYLIRHQQARLSATRPPELEEQKQKDDGGQAGNESDIIRYRRDEVILLLMILYGVRQYQLGSLKLSQLQKNGKDVSLTVKRGFTITLEGIVLQKLRDYLSIRKSNADTIFLEPLRKKPVDHSSIRAVLTELSYALRLECSPRSLYNTYLHLQQNPEERQRLIERIASERFESSYEAVSNA